MMDHGKRTRQIAERLEEKLLAYPNRYPGVKIFYDHGDSFKESVCQPTSYIGRRYGADATMSGLDIVLVHKGKVFLLVEVEESQVRPKTILGDIFGVVLSERVRIKAKSYPIENATMIVAMIVNSKGQQAEKYIRLERHLHKYLSALRKIMPKTRADKIRIVTSDSEDLVRRIERLEKKEWGQVLYYNKIWCIKMLSNKKC